LSFFFLAMILNPAFQSRAQAELDKVIGRRRLVDSSDEENLPCIKAIVKEVLRWRPVAPLAFPHCTTEDDIYDGMRIPKGSMIFPNVWSEGFCTYYFVVTEDN